MRTTFKNRNNAFILGIFTAFIIGIFTFSDKIITFVEAHNMIPYSIDWTNTNLITVDNTWSVSNELGVRGYSGSDTPVTPGQDARTVLVDSLALNVRANQTDPNTLIPGGVTEFEIANPTIALKGSDTAQAPYINLLMDSRNLNNIRVRFNIRDLDSTAKDAIQQVAVQYRTRDDETGPFTDVPSAYVADATDPNTATKVTPVDVILPALADGHIALEIRIVTVNAVGEDEWIGIDDIQVTAEGPTPLPTPPTISGRVTYITSPTAPSVPNTTITANGSSSFSSTTDISGVYSMTNFGAGAYTLTPSKANQISVSNGFSNLDASRIAQHVVGLFTLNATQLIAADTSNNGSVSALDAAYIAQFLVGTSNPGITGAWKFTPANRSYSSILTSQTDQDFGAILIGDVTGNWNPSGALRPDFQASNREKVTKVVTVTATANRSAERKRAFTVDLMTEDTTNAGILGYQFELLYDPKAIEPQANPCDISETISSSQTAICRADTPGVLKVVLFGATPISGKGIMLKLKFNAVGATSSTSAMTLRNFMFNEGTAQDGQVFIANANSDVALIGGLKNK